MMRPYYHHLQAYFFIKGNTLRKKMRTYSLALQVIMDRTTAIYYGILMVYLLFAIFITYDLFQGFEQSFLVGEKIASESFQMVFTLFPIIYVLRSFRNPGVIFSSSEQKLSILTFSRKKIWLIVFLEKWLYQTIIYFGFGFLVTLITPLSLSLVFTYIGLIIGSHLLLTIPQWRLFHKNIYIKLSILLLTLMLHLINSFWVEESLTIIWLLITFILVSNVFFWRKTLFQDVNWDEVIELGDFYRWNMPLISRISGVEIKRPRGISLFQRLFWRRKPFKYKQQSIYHRLWHLYFGKNFTLVFQTIGALFVILSIFSFIGDWLFLLILAVAIYVYTSIAKVFFLSRFTVDIIEVLPWNLAGYKRAFLKWAFIGGLVLLLPIGLYVWMNLSIWLPFQLLFYGGAFVCMLHGQINQAISTLKKEIVTADRTLKIGYLSLGCIVISWSFPYILWVGLLFLLYLGNSKKRFNFP